jgi:hypothetical protein
VACLRVLIASDPRIALTVKRAFCNELLDRKTAAAHGLPSLGPSSRTVTGYHCKHAMRVLRRGPISTRQGSRPGRRVYGEAVRGNACRAARRAEG